MTQTSTTAELFIVAIQDLLDAKQAWIERSDTLGEHAGNGIKTFLADQRSRAETQAQRLTEVLRERGAALKGPPNI